MRLRPAIRRTLQQILATSLLSLLAVTLAFDHDGGPELAGFRVQKSATADCAAWADWKDLPATERTFTDEIPTTKGTVCYRVFAFSLVDDKAHLSDPSNVVKVSYTNQAKLLRVQQLKQAP